MYDRTEPGPARHRRWPTPAKGVPTAAALVLGGVDFRQSDHRSVLSWSIVAHTLGREMRRHAADREVNILRASGAADDLDELVTWTANGLDHDAAASLDDVVAPDGYLTVGR